MKAYSPDLRSSIVAAVDAGMSKAEAARRFDVALSNLKRYVRQQAATGSLLPAPRPGRTPLIRSHQLEDLRAQVRDHTAAYLDEHCTLWKRAHGIAVSRITMSSAVRRAGFTRKKNDGRQRAGRAQAPHLAPGRHPSRRRSVRLAGRVRGEPHSSSPLRPRAERIELCDLLEYLLAEG